MKLQLNRLCLAWRSIALSAVIALPLLPAEAAAPPELDREPVAGETCRTSRATVKPCR